MNTVHLLPGAGVYKYCTVRRYDDYASVRYHNCTVLLKINKTYIGLDNELQVEIYPDGATRNTFMQFSQAGDVYAELMKLSPKLVLSYWLIMQLDLLRTHSSDYWRFG